jgi:hypothetical protein
MALQLYEREHPEVKKRSSRAPLRDDDFDNDIPPKVPKIAQPDFGPPPPPFGFQGGALGAFGGYQSNVEAQGQPNPYSQGGFVPHDQRPLPSFDPRSLPYPQYPQYPVPAQGYSDRGQASGQGYRERGQVPAQTQGQGRRASYMMEGVQASTERARRRSGQREPSGRAPRDDRRRGEGQHRDQTSRQAGRTRRTKEERRSGFKRAIRDICKSVSRTCWYELDRDCTRQELDDVHNNMRADLIEAYDAHCPNDDASDTSWS